MIRRIIRIILLIFTFALVLALPWILIFVSLQESEYKLDAVKLQKITLQNCQFFFQLDNAMAPGVPRIDVRTARKYFFPPCPTPPPFLSYKSLCE